MHGRDQRHPKKQLERSLFLLLSLKCGSCFGLFDIAGKTQYMYIVRKTKYICTCCQTGQKSLLKAWFCTCLLKLVQINLIFSDNMHTVKPALRDNLWDEDKVVF